MKNALRAAATAACAFAAVYALLRCAQAAFFPSPDPRTVLVVGRIAFYWRVAIAALGALLAGLGGSALAARDPVTFDERVLPTVLTATLAIGVLQGVFVP